MSLTIKELLQTFPHRSLKMLAGQRGILRAIRSANIMDSPDVANWVQKDELVLSTGYLFAEDPQALIELIEDLSSAGAAGLAIKTARFLGTLPVEAVDTANHLSFPIIDIPNALSLAEIMTRINTRIARAQEEVGQSKPLLQQLRLAKSPDDFAELRRLAPYLWAAGELSYVLIGFEKALPRQLSEALDFARELLLRTNPLSLYTIENGKILLLLVSDRRLTYNDHPVLVIYSAVMKQYADIRPYIGIGLPVRTPEQLSESLDVAREGLRLARTPGQPSILFPHQTLSHRLTDTPIIKSFYDMFSPALADLEEADDTFLDTLSALLENRHRLKETASTLFIHRNTLSNRLERIENVLCMPFDDEELMLALRLALRHAKRKKEST
ncbi:PucR family transcriptional regulator [Selenomonas sp. TAMA-11512]|uniref:PucR family transcriptional regulator n=1 Tax=Selenomonas sp. TAMA-11512 TaxID=3095337 RepID=UPI003086704B|nr:PucR family transcriptional regulator [Selenomonas sp. TAMA-11512]